MDLWHWVFFILAVGAILFILYTKWEEGGVGIPHRQMALRRVVWYEGVKYSLDRRAGKYLTDQGKEMSWFAWWIFVVPRFERRHWEKQYPNFIKTIESFCKQPDISNIPVVEEEIVTGNMVISPHHESR